MAGFQSLGSTDGNRQKQCLGRFLVKYRFKLLESFYSDLKHFACYERLLIDCFKSTHTHLLYKPQ